MDEESTRRLVQSRNYCTDRLIEVKAEITKLQDEGTVLKRTLESTVDELRAGSIRRRRSFLGRRIDELKAERGALITEREAATAQLASLPSAPGQDGP